MTERRESFLYQFTMMRIDVGVRDEAKTERPYASMRIAPLLYEVKKELKNPVVERMKEG